VFVAAGAGVVDIRPRLTPDLEEILAIELVNGRKALEYLGSH